MTGSKDSATQEKIPTIVPWERKVPCPECGETFHITLVDGFRTAYLLYHDPNVDDRKVSKNLEIRHSWLGHMATCFQGHFKHLSICIEANGDVQEIGREWRLSARTKMVLQMALSLVDETELEDVLFYRDMNAIVMCPQCYKEGTISDEALEAMMEIREKGGELDEYVVL